MKFQGFPDRAFEFYAGLEKDNSKEYWHSLKDVYDTCVRTPVEALAEALEERYGPVKVWRPQRDVRFSNDKSPYKTYQGITAGSADSVGYYAQLSAEGLRLGAGFHGGTEQLGRYRDAVDDERHGPELERIVRKLERNGWSLVGERLRTRPRGFPADHPRLELLRYRSLGAERLHPPTELHGPEALDLVRKGWSGLKPLTDWLEARVSGEGRP
ncbi:MULTISPECIES: DUF2461 domain-containing protein [Streptomyces]|uniref:TIGR02453 family protein n=1 Tax=Streptomyces radiopugnans TaxID=403935 RepID=A0A1H9K7W7_9ACTN|nr:DUF2461 domain-containing protein [Streptomyces radiopugnans]SEQ95162.1 TIGR02453 family protein [Streptomyces radiopugnans]